MMRTLFKNAFYAAQRRGGRLRMRVHPPAGSRTRFAIFDLHTIAPASNDMAVTEPRLRAQLSALLDAGYCCLSLAEALCALANPDPLPAPAFCLTFDDGYRTVYECGLPILEDLNLTATLFLTVNFLDRRIQPPWHSRDKALLHEYAVNAKHFLPLAWPQVRELIASRRFQIGSHTLNHFMAGHLPEAELRTEIRDSKQILQDRVGVEAAFFAYPYGVRPYGAYTERSEAIIRESGYRCSCTSRISRAAVGSGPWLLPRLSLVEADTPVDALAKAAGAYDWVAMAQNSFHGIFPNPHVSR